MGRLSEGPIARCRSSSGVEVETRLKGESKDSNCNLLSTLEPQPSTLRQNYRSLGGLGFRFIHAAALPGDRYPMAVSTLNGMTGRGQSGGSGRRRYTSIMKFVYAGAARRPPCASDMIFFGLSKPTQTPATRFAVKPTNQTSAPSFVVPVLPAEGTRKPAFHTRPTAEPRSTTSFSMSTMTQASAVDSTGTVSAFVCQRTFPSESSTRRIALGFVRVPRLAKVVYPAISSSGNTSADP